MTAPSDLALVVELALLVTDRTPDEQAALDRAITTGALDDLMPDSWRRHRWSASVAYSTTASAVRHDGNHANRSTEVLWFSPHCLSGQMPTLFGTSA